MPGWGAPMPEHWQDLQGWQPRGPPWELVQGLQNRWAKSGSWCPQPWGWQPSQLVPPPPQPQPHAPPPLGPPPPQSAVAEGIGTMSGVYVYVGAKANIEHVAVDLRNQAPILLIVCCSDEDAAARMGVALSEEAVDMGRKRGDHFQVTFKCVVFKELIVAGRRPVVKEVDIKETLFTPGGGAVLIADLGLHVMVQGQLSIRVAAFASDRIRGGGEWIKVQAALEHRSVRLMAGEFGETLMPLLAALRTHMTIKVCAMKLCTDKEDGAVVMTPPDSGGHALTVEPSAMLLAGPVGRLTISETRGSGGSSETRGRGVNIASLNFQSYVGEEGKDVSRGWPVIANVKQKEVRTVLPHTRKLLVFLGSNTANRTPKALEARDQKLRKRLDAWKDKEWAQRFAQWRR